MRGKKINEYNLLVNELEEKYVYLTGIFKNTAISVVSFTIKTESRLPVTSLLVSIVPKPLLPLYKSLLWTRHYANALRPPIPFNSPMP